MTFIRTCDDLRNFFFVSAFLNVTQHCMYININIAMRDNKIQIRIAVQGQIESIQ